MPRSFAELIDQTWPEPKDAHDLERYLEDWWEKNGGQFPPERNGGHWVGAAADIQQLAKKSAAARRPRRPRKPATPAHTTSNRAQMELLF